MGRNKNIDMTAFEHLAELRVRLAISAACLFLAAIGSFTYVDSIRSILVGALGDYSLIYLTPPEAFIANLRLAFLSGFIISLPLILYQISAYVFPGLNRGEKIFYICVLLGAIILFSAGVTFAYFVVFPIAIRFFLQFASAQLVPQFTVSEYISFFISFHLAFGIVFQLPLMTWSLGKIGLLTSDFLKKYRKIALLIMLIMSAIITPPDVVSQMFLVLPLLLLYELGVVLVIVSEKKREKRFSEQE